MENPGREPGVWVAGRSALRPDLSEIAGAGVIPA
jgi:hypothetical protein